jgi:CDP-glycerol glycerophosphotransferase
MSKLSKLVHHPLAFLRDAFRNVFRSSRPTDDALSASGTRKPLSVELRYARLLETEPIAENVILYESFHGTTMSCNPLALFREIANAPEFSGFLHVWALNERMDCSVGRELLDHVEFVKVHSTEYLRYLACAKYLVNNTSFPPYFQRREEQVYLNTWHGTPWKTLGRDMRGSIGQHKNIQRNLAQATHLLCQNSYMTERVLHSHDLDGIYEGKVLEVGYPRVDITVSADPQQVRRKLAISSNKPILLIAPTWRGEVNKVSKVTPRFLEDMARICAELGSEFTILFRGHSLERKQIASLKLDCSVVPNNIDTNELLAAVDCLVTDYSSILFDFLVLRRPVFLYAYDLESYAHDRGLYFGAEEIPAYLCRSVDELLNAIRTRDWCKDHEAVYSRFRERFLTLEDGHASGRVVRALWQGDESGARTVSDPNKKNVLFYCGGFANNGVTSSALNLFSCIDYSKYNVIVVDGGEMDAERERNITRLPRQLKLFLRAGNCNTLPQEAQILSRYYSSGVLDRESEGVLREHYHRERRRLLGETRVDIAVDFSGYVKFWTLLFGLGRFTRRVIYQHNDMLAENSKVINGKYKHRHNFKVIFDAYRFFDWIVSVSEQTRDLNYASLRSFVDERKSVFEYVTNTLDHQGLLAKAQESRELNIHGERYWHGRLDKAEGGTITAKLYPVPSRDHVNFIHIGRFSPEKRHDRLLDAFAEVHRRVPTARLYLVGDGVLFETVRARVHQLGLGDEVIQLGQLDNPYWLLRRCHCLVLSSDHEGQPMVLLESLTLGTPVVATDIVGSRSVLGDDHGILVPPSVEGVVFGMMQYVEGRISALHFDAKAYQASSMDRFYSVVCGDGEERAAAPRPDGTSNRLS